MVEVFRSGRFTIQRIGALAGLTIWLAIIARLLSTQIDHQSRIGIGLAAALALAPLAVANIPRVPAYLLAAYAAIIPFNTLLVTDSGATLAKLVAMACAAAMAGAILIHRRAISPAKPTLVLLALTAYVGLTVLWSVDPAKGMSTYGDFLTFVLFYVLISAYPATAADLKLVLGATVAGALAAAAYGDYLFWHGQQIFGVRLYIGYDAQHSIDPNEYAATLLTPIAITLVLFLRARLGLRKLLSFALLCALFSGFAISGSRGAAIGLVAVLAVIFWQTGKKFQLLAMLIPAAGALFVSPIGVRLMRPDAMTGDLRTELWKVGISALPQYWLQGAGPGNFQAVYDQYYLSTWHLATQWSRPAHSIFLQSAIEYGIVGFLLVIALWYMMFKELREAQDDAELGAVALALRASVAGLFAVGFSLDLLMNKYTWLAFSLVAIVRSALITNRTSVGSRQSTGPD